MNLKGTTQAEGIYKSNSEAVTGLKLYLCRSGLVEDNGGKDYLLQDWGILLQTLK